MTRKAKAINAFVETLSLLAINGTAIKLGMNDPDKPERRKEFTDLLDHYQRSIKGHLTTIVENNEEQAEALLDELGLHWKNKV